jgi:molybdate transport system substrate-binding protein
MKLTARAAWAFVLLGTVAASCSPRTASSGSTPSARTLTVFAAASLAEVFSEIGGRIEAQSPGLEVEYNFASSGRLLLQLQLGARADLFAAASPDEINEAISSLLVNPDEARLFARNRLVVVVPPDNPGDVQSLGDLARPGLRLALAAESAPVGRYALEMLDRMSLDPAYGADFRQRVLANVVSFEENVRAVVAKVTLGEVDAGVVYASDAAGAQDSLGVIEVPAQFTPEITYWVAPLAQADQAALARQFIDLLLSPSGAEVLSRHGFEPNLQP